MIFPELKELDAPVKKTEKYIKNHYKDFYNYLTDNYVFCKCFTEKLYCYFNDIASLVVCPVCGDPVSFISFKNGYRTYCSNKCQTSSESRNSKIKQTKLERYGDENYNNISKIKDTCLERYGEITPLLNDECKRKTKQTCLERYGNELYQSTEDCKRKIENTFLENYGVTNCFKDDIIKEKIKTTMLKRYGVDNFSKTNIYLRIVSNKKDEINKKIYKTKKENNSFNTSSIEKQFEEYLKENNINYKTQYKSKLYPFSCDFYFPDSDLYLEINAHWTHGGHPFDSTNKDDLLLLEQWKSKNTEFYNNAIQTWTVRDVQKRECAKKNNLNYFEVFTNNILELKNIYNSLITN